MRDLKQEAGIAEVIENLSMADFNLHTPLSAVGLGDYWA